MTRKIKWTLSIGYPSADRTGEFEVDDTCTDEEIEMQVREEAYQYVELFHDVEEA